MIIPSRTYEEKTWGERMVERHMLEVIEIKCSQASSEVTKIERWREKETGEGLM